MNVDIFIETRKRMHLSQDQLAQGICTQATLSKFERNGKVPSLKILLQLCDRLELTLDDLFPVNQSGDSKRAVILESAETHLQQEMYPLVHADLEKLGDPVDDSVTFQLRYYFLRGYATALSHGSISDALYDFSQILNRLDEGHHSMYAMLAYTGTGIAYNQANDSKRAEFYFNKVFGEIRNLSFKTRHSIWRALNIINYTAEFYSQQGDYETSDDLLAYGVKVCAQYHVTFYLARIVLRRALNLQQHGADRAKIQQDLDDAAAFARLNNNQHVLGLIRDAEATLD
ncbi:helix-turn-helix domain-containing protein [Levilactobacillus zymae]|uniref:Transcriptional regulator n=1 Tax=Levilactobacillus zymae TaxID=267363 RepID=A0A1Y6JYP4_9LACO|nr:helix-turn-helix transcriptional regulator [Levilactobacillus zymae]KRL11149.1 XRE family transcriptional regulator [Levilactobacillus zymae DSM 19395]QFR60047.1 helix-turn-helix domain-containing protein [Levilactobacillus zymae]QFR62401.1 helix-turn-helix domain-containing protein [Levilactobacillus zymae]SMS14985.1 transcriptional regulator, Cro/CI family [Levilactobacillus zymae]GEO71518.1 transcriptional regulator [Levilactobacillus zymae]